MLKARDIEKVNEIVREAGSFPDDQELTPETTVTELGLDSLDMTEIQMDLEEEFEIDDGISEEDLSKLVTMQDLYTLVDSKAGN